MIASPKFLTVEVKMLFVCARATQLQRTEANVQNTRSTSMDPLHTLILPPCLEGP